MLLNILIRTSNRPALFARCLDSVLSQGYEDLRIIVSYDTEVKPWYIPENIEAIFVTADGSLPYFYDCYLNNLKALVTSGWFLILDDDDFLMPDVLNKLVLDAPAILVQLDHPVGIVPRSENFGLGQVGFPCLILHHSLKNLADMTGGDHGDYHWIKAVQSAVGLKFVPLVVVKSDRKGNGQTGLESGL